jgi:hypothetical protein
MRIVIEDGDELTVTGARGATAPAAAVAERDVADGGGAPTALIRQFAQEHEIAELAPEEPERPAEAPPPPGEQPLNPLRAGADVARGTAQKGGSAPRPATLPET